MHTTAVEHKNEVIQRLRTEFLELSPNVAAHAVLPGTDLHETFGLDSLGIIEFISSVEYLFQVTIADEDLPDLTTLNKIADYLLARS